MKRHECFTVLGKPFFSVGGQLHNSSSYALGAAGGEKYMQDMETSFASIKALGANTVAVPVCWDALEPEEGVFDCGYVKRIIERTRENGLHAVLLWFGTWKNGQMEYTPAWVKRDRKRFKRSLLPDGRETAVMSPFYDTNREQDKRAFCKLMEIVKECDEQYGTVIAVQVENEPGGLAAAMRDFSEKGTEAFEGPVPAEMIDAAKNDDGRVGAYWKKNGCRESGSWAEVFGYFGAELCYAWATAKYIDDIAYAGKQIYDIFMYVNVWTDRNTVKGFSMAGLDYPAGGAVSKVLPAWYTAASHLDAICPDIYDGEAEGIRLAQTNYDSIEKGYPLYVPESGMSKINATLMFEAVGKHQAIGYHIFAAESALDEEGNLREGAACIRRSFDMLTNASDLILKYRGTDKMFTLTQNLGQDSQRLEVDDWMCRASFAGASADFAGWVAMDYRHGKDLINVNHVPVSLNEETARGLLFRVDEKEYYLVGHKVRLYWQRMDRNDGSIPGNMLNLEHQAYNMELLKIEEGHFENGEYVVDKVRSGDEARHGIWAQADCGVIHFVLGE